MVTIHGSLRAIGITTFNMHVSKGNFRHLRVKSQHIFDHFNNAILIKNAIFLLVHCSQFSVVFFRSASISSRDINWYYQTRFIISKRQIYVHFPAAASKIKEYLYVWCHVFTFMRTMHASGYFGWMNERSTPHIRCTSSLISNHHYACILHLKTPKKCLLKWIFSTGTKIMR